MSVLLMLIGSSMADSAETNTGQAVERSSLPSKSVVAGFTYANLMQLSKMVGITQANFVSTRRTKLLCLITRNFCDRLISRISDLKSDANIKGIECRMTRKLSDSLCYC